MPDNKKSSAPAWVSCLIALVMVALFVGAIFLIFYCMQFAVSLGVPEIIVILIFYAMIRGRDI